MSRKQVKGTGSVTNAAQNATVIAAEGASTAISVLKGHIAVTVASSGGTGLVALEDGSGGTKLLTMSAATVGNFPFDLQDIDGRGYDLTENTLLNLTVEGATTQASAQATVMAQVRRV